MKKRFQRKLLLLSLPALVLSACGNEKELHRSGNILVSNPKVSGQVLHIRIINDTGRSLCYFKNSLFYGRGVIEGNTDKVRLSKSPMLFPLRELQFSSGSDGGSISKLSSGAGKIAVSISGDKLSQGDDIQFPIFFCEKDGVGGYRVFFYTARV